MARAHAVSPMHDPEPDLAHHGSSVHELGTIFQRLAAHGDRAWLEEILVLAQKRLSTLEAAHPDELHDETEH